MLQIVHSLSRALDIDASLARFEERSRHVLINDDSVCDSCHARLGTKLFAMYPDDTIVCYKVCHVFIYLWLIVISCSSLTLYIPSLSQKKHFMYFSSVLTYYSPFWLAAWKLLGRTLSIYIYRKRVNWNSASFIVLKFRWWYCVLLLSAVFSSSRWVNLRVRSRF